jgi:hypothetical protein
MPKPPFPEGAPGLVFSPTSHWCPRHLEPFREDWGKNVDWILATMGLLEECIRRPEIVRAAGRDIAMLNRVLVEYAPLCCYLGDETTDRWVQLSLGPLDDYTHALEAIRARSAE